MSQGRAESMVDEVFNDRSVAVVTGASSGLGYAVASLFAQSGYQVVLVGRDPSRVTAAIERFPPDIAPFASGYACDVTDHNDVQKLFEFVKSQYGKLHVLVNCVGKSDRGLLQDISAKQMQHLFEVNVLSSLYCTQGALPLLEQSGGVVLNVGSLASKVGARYIGGYSTVKHALAGLTQQFRLELKHRGVHVCLLSPGPIKRSDEGQRYRDQVDSNLPDQANRPGGGTRVKGLSPEYVAQVALTMIQKRQADRVLPRYLRLLIAIGNMWPRIGDWLLLKFTSSKN
jgi:short-subunit dehydrogenase